MERLLCVNMNSDSMSMKSIAPVMGTSSGHAVHGQSAQNRFDYCNNFLWDRALDKLLISFSSILLDSCSINYLKHKNIKT